MSQLKDFQTIKKLGDGAFSSVHQVKRISDGAVYALKKVKMGKLSEKEKQNAVNEIRILASINHPNVIGYKEAFFENKEGCLCIIMELADGGDLLQAIEQHKKQKTKFTEKQIWHYFIQIVRGLKALHDLKIVHRDIKCANLFMTKAGIIKLGDLNVSKVAKKGLLQTQTGTPYYASPEVWKDQPYNHSSDIWSLGCVLYEMITLLPPFRAQSMQALATKVTRGVYDRLPAQFSADLSQMVKSCLQVTASARPSCDKILATPGLLNHLTGTLEDLDIDPAESEGADSLLKTIRCPRNLGMITDRLPAPQYRPKMKRCNSMAIDGVKGQLEVAKDTKEIKLKTNLKESQFQMPVERRVGASRVLCNLPTIEEDQVDDETIEVLSSLEKQIGKVNAIVGRPKGKRLQAKARLDNNSDHQKVEKQLSYDHRGSEPACQSEQRSISRQADRAKPPTNPRSADVYAHKAKANLLAKIPYHKPTPSNGSDNEDASTRVSSKSQAQRNYVYHKQNALVDKYDNYASGHDSQTPSHISAKYQDLHERVVAAAAGIPRLPSIKPNARLQSVDALDRDRLYAYNMPSQIQSARGGSRYQNHRNESLGVSRALGINNNRYEGVGSAIRLARAASKEALPSYQPRGPCPTYLSKVQSNGHLVSDQRPVALNRYQSEQRGLQAIYSSRRHLQVHQSADYDSQPGRMNHHYHYPQVPNTRFKHY